MSTTTYVVTGMTCDHCAASVREEVGELAGVTDVVVDLPTGRVLVTTSSEQAPDGRDSFDAAVRAAVEEAGYSLA